MNAGGPSRNHLPDGRWHFQHGPIDLIIGCEGVGTTCARAIEQCWARFETVLSELVSELPLLRTDCRLLMRAEPPCGAIAQRMFRACLPYAQHWDLFITPMAAVAGAVADELIGALAQPGIDKAYINNGGDIALHLAGSARFDIGIVTDAHAPAIDAVVPIDHASIVRGVATSGWRGRSQSLGIADSVTVLAASAAVADAAATMIANHVNVSDSSIIRRAASQLRDDSDLGELPVTVAVGSLSAQSIASALAQGVHFAQSVVQRNLIEHTALHLAGAWRQVSRATASHPARVEAVL